MKQLISLLRARNVLTVGILAIAMIVAFSSLTFAQQHIRPDIPRLTLTGSISPTGYNNVWYPDGFIRTTVSEGGTANVPEVNPRYILVPVFIENRWVTGTDTNFVADPILSFQFTVQYDSTTLRAIGVQDVHPVSKEVAEQRNDMRYMNNFGQYYQPLANGWNFEISDVRDNTYHTYYNPNAREVDRNKGRSITIVGTSTRPLAETPRNNPMVLLYIKFRVEPNQGNIEGTSSPIIIKDEVIKYNDLNIRKEAPFMDERKLDDTRAGEYYPDPTSYDETLPGGDVTGLAGMRNDTKKNDGSGVWALSPVLPGMIWVKVSDKIPTLEFSVDRAIGLGILKDSDNPNGSYYYLAEPITTDSTGQPANYGSRQVQIKIDEGDGQTRIQDLSITTDQPWLKVNIEKQNQTPTNWARNQFIKYIDNGILGEQKDPLADIPPDDGEIYMNIQCDPSEISEGTPDDPDKAGVYVGHITFKSSTMEIDPVRIKVVFMYFRSPAEYYRIPEPPGIKLTLKTAKYNAGDPEDVREENTERLIFGSGNRATDRVDSLYGEFEYESALPTSRFAARWFYYPETYPDLAEEIEYGLGDFCPNDENPYSDSRDIRDHSVRDRSHLFYCKFNPYSQDNYPITIEWNTGDFPDKSRLFLRDAVNGQYFAIDMRTATPGTQQGAMSYQIQDSRWAEFIIEYTLPSEMDFVDDDDQPIINKGWNFLSLPYNPLDPTWNVFYPNAINVPYFFSQNQYQEPPDGMLKQGIGYFIKYGDNIDRQFTGAKFYKLPNPMLPVNPQNAHLLYNGDVPDPGTNPKKYGGWNTIGGLSIPVSIEAVDFVGYGTNLSDQERDELRQYVLKYGIWRYETDRGYSEVAQILPGLGYWLKINKTVFYALEATREAKLNSHLPLEEKEVVLNNSVEMTVRDNAQHESSLYITNNSEIDTEYFELPPAPPAEMFDVRYSDNKYLSSDNVLLVKLQGVEYPLSISINEADKNYTFTDALTGEIFGSITKGNNGNIEIDATSGDAIKVLAQEVNGFEANAYPNPASTSSNIKFNVPNQQMVNITLYDAIGNEIKTIANDEFSAGEHSLNVNVNELAVGNYMIKVTTGNKTEMIKLNVIR